MYNILGNAHHRNMVSIFFIILIGIRIVSYIDVKKQYITLDIYILKRILVLKIKIFLCDDKIYYQINRREIKQIKRRELMEVEEEFVKKISISKVELRKLYINVGYSILQNPHNILIFATIKQLVDTAMYLLGDFLVVDDYELLTIPMTNDEYKINFQLEIGLGLYVLGFKIIKDILKKRGVENGRV